MAYTSFTHCTAQEYTDIIYSQDDKNRARIWFNDVEMQDVGIKCEKITRTARIIPNDGKKVFTLSNFVSTELEVILHDVDLEDIVDQVKISIGTIVGSDSLGDTYEDVPLGIFNIQEVPVINDNKVTLKLRDNRVKFDFNYNALPLIENNYFLTEDATYQSGKKYYVYNASLDSYEMLVEGTDYEIGDNIVGDIYEKKDTVTKMQILNDICSQAGVNTKVTSFQGEDDELAIYNNTRTATQYISYIAEQAGCIPTIDREGELIFVDLTNLHTWRIPKSIVPKPLTIGTPYEIQRVVYESGIIKYESSPDETLDTLYLNANNMYITEQSQIDYIYNLLNGFTLDTVTTQNLLGNPAIDPYDLIEIYDDYDEEEPVIATTLANMFYTFNGVHRQSFDTQIGKEQRKENVTIKGQSTFERWARTEINNIESTVAIQTGKIEELEDTENNNYHELLDEFSNYATIETIDNITNTVEQLQTDTYTKTQIQQIANGDGYDFAITTDTNYLADKEYYSYDDANKTYTLLVAGTDYTVGDAISGDVYNKYSVTVTAVISTEAQFDKDGMHYSKTNAPTSSTIDYKGLEVDDTNNNELLFAGYDEDDQSLTYGTSVVRTNNLTVKTYLQCADGKGRIEKYTDSNNNVGAGFFLT